MSFRKMHDPAFVGQYSKEGKGGEWKTHVEQHIGRSFEYTVQGWPGSHFQTTSVTLCLEVSEDSFITCSNCKSLFGCSHSTKSEYHAYKHAVARHRPPRKTKNGANTNSGGKRTRTTTISSFFSMKSKKSEHMASPSSGASSLSTLVLSDGDPSSNNTKHQIHLSSSVPMSSAVSPSPSKSTKAIVIHKKTETIAGSNHHSPANAIVKPSYIRSLEELKGLPYNICAGIRNDLPEPLERNFPMLIGDVIPNFTQEKIYYDPLMRTLRDASCETWVLDVEGAETSNDFLDFRCQRCEDISSDKMVEDILSRATSDTIHQTTIKNGYLTINQILLKLKATKESNDALRLTSLNLSRKINRKCRALELKHRIILTVARGDVLRLHQIVNRCINEKRSSGTCLEMIDAAVAGTYRPKGYSEHEILQQVLTFRFGGHRLMYAQNHSGLYGAASVRTVKRRMNIPRHITMCSEIVFNIVYENMENTIFNDDFTTDVDRKSKCLWTLMIDDVKVEKRVRVEEATDRCVGGCYHFYKEGVSTDLISKEDFTDIRDALQSGQGHYATELTCVALAPNREKEYHPRVVATSAGCLNGDPIERTRLLVEYVCKIWENHPKGQKTRGILSTLQPDGASTFVKIGHELFFGQEMKGTHPLYPILSKLDLFCMSTGVGPEYERMTIGCEQKHVFKRTRERIKSEIGFTMLDYEWTGSVIEKLLIDCGSCKQSVQKMFAKGYADAMNVPEMVKLYNAISEMSKKESSEFQTKSVFVQGIKKELKFMGIYCNLINEVLIGKKSLGSHLEDISCLMHINFVCYRRNGTKFLPGQNFTNQQRYHRSIFWSVATAMTEGVLEYFLFLDAGDRLEELYGLLRTLSGGASGTGDGMDALQAAERINCVQEIAKIFALYPELQKASKHLKTTHDHQNPRSYLRNEKGEEHREYVDVTKISNLRNKYIRGRRKATDYLKEAGFQLHEYDWDTIKKETNVDMIRPNGIFVGISLDDCDSDADEMDSKAGVTSHEEDNEVRLWTDSVAFDEKLGGIPKTKGERSSAKMGKVTVSPGVEVNKAKYLRSLLEQQHVTETSRVGRNQGKVKSGTAAVNMENAGYTSDEELIRANEDPIATLVLTKANKTHGLALVIVSVERFQREGMKNKEIEIPHQDFAGNTVVEGKFVPIQFSEQEFSWNIQKRSCVKMNVFAQDAVVLNPDIRTCDAVDESNETVTEYFIDLDTLQKVFDKLVLDYNNTTVTKKRVLFNIEGKTQGAPYRNGNELLLFKALHDSSNILSSTSTDVERRNNSREFVCAVPGCGKIFPCKDMRHHVAWHILCDSKIEEKAHIKTGELCGICGMNQAMTYHSGGTDIGCSAWLENKRGGSKKLRYLCQHHDEITINYKSALNSTKAAPSTNVPIECPLCTAKMGKGNAQHYFKYNFLHHWNKMHKGIEMGDELRNTLLITEEEKRDVKKFKDPKKSRKPKKKEAVGKDLSTMKPSYLKTKERMSKISTGLERTNAKTIGLHFASSKSNTTQSKASAKCLFPDGASPPPTPHATKYPDLKSFKVCMPVSNFKDSKYKCELLKEILSEDQEAASLLILASANRSSRTLLAEESSRQYGYGNCQVTYKSIATLKNGERIGDEVINFAFQLINDRNINKKIHEKSKSYSYIVNTYFVNSLVGLNDEGMASMNIPFTGGMVKDREKALKRYARKWLPNVSSQPKHIKGDKDNNISVVDLVQEHGLEVLIFPINITGYHWFFIAADMDSCTVTVYDSCFAHEHSRKHVLKKGSNDCGLRVETSNYILDLIEKTKFNDIPFENLQLLCEQYQLKTHGTKIEMFRSIMRPLFAQEIVRYLKWETKRSINNYEVREWKVFISNDMPQQSISGDNCGLYTVAGADMISDSGDVSNIDSERLEMQGRLMLAHLCLKVPRTK